MDQGSLTLTTRSPPASLPDRPTPLNHQLQTRAFDVDQMWLDARHVDRLRFQFWSLPVQSRNMHTCFAHMHARARACAHACMHVRTYQTSHACPAHVYMHMYMHVQVERRREAVRKATSGGSVPARYIK